MICTPPGVTSLPQCTPVDPCTGTPVNGSCVTYAGADFSCLDVTTGDDIIQVMFKILEYYKPLDSSECCTIGDAIIEYAPPLTTTTTSTTSTTTTTTTTFEPECSNYQITNISNTGTSTIEYVPCGLVEYTDPVEVKTYTYICVNNSFTINLLTGNIDAENFGACNSIGPVPTTTTTTVPCECGVYTVENTTNDAITINYTGCEDDDRLPIKLTVGGKKIVPVCACSNILSQATEFLLVKGPDGSCSTTPTTTTSTSTTSTTTSSTTTSTSTTTTSTTQAPCYCYIIQNVSPKSKSYSYRDCDTRDIVNASIGGNSTVYRCAVENSIIPSVSVEVTSVDLCGNVNCNPPLFDITIGESSSEVCGGGGSSISGVTGNAPTFCQSTEFYSDDFIDTPPGTYYLYDGTYYVEILVGTLSNVAQVLSECMTCPTTTTTSTTTSTTTTSTTTSTTSTTTSTTAPPLPVTGLIWETEKTFYFPDEADPEIINNDGDPGCEDAGWVVSNFNQTIRFNISDSVGCGGTCDYVQTGIATATITVGASDTDMTVNITGLAEREATGYEDCTFILDGTPIVEATSPGGGLGCAMGPVVQTVLQPGPYTLLAGSTHTFTINFSTDDRLYHQGAYYEVTLSFT
jgi:hypothetical protein